MDSDEELRDAALPVPLFLDMECVFISSFFFLENILSFSCGSIHCVPGSLSHGMPPSRHPASHLSAVRLGKGAALRPGALLLLLLLLMIITRSARR